jgi:hypothetical protein
LILVIAVGCSTSKTPSRVSGKVTYKGEPVGAGTVTFHTKDGGIFYYPLQPDGSYSGADLTTGEMIVTVDTEAANPKRSGTVYGGKGKEGGPSDYMKKMKERGAVPEGPIIDGKYVKIPDKYMTKEKSPLKVNLTKGQNENNFDLKDD